MVQLEERFRVEWVGLFQDFNSSMVQLEVPKAITIMAMKIFQFQYGAIRSIIKEFVSEIEQLFQFQYGAIRRGYFR